MQSVEPVLIGQKIFYSQIVYFDETRKTGYFINPKSISRNIKNPFYAIFTKFGVKTPNYEKMTLIGFKIRFYPGLVF